MTIRKVLNEFTQLEELIVDAVIQSVGNKVLTNTKGTEYRIATVVANMPNGKTQTGSTCIWEKLHEANEYEKGDVVSLAIQLDGEYAGYSKIFLEGSSRFDVAEFIATEGVALSISKAETIVEANVLEKEEVM